MSTAPPLVRGDHQREHRRFMPTMKAIRKWWANTSLWSLKGYDGPDHFEAETGACFACGLESDRGNFLERSHIVPHCLGGSPEASNLHLLCPTCHRQSEWLENESAYYAWFFERSAMDSLLSNAFNVGAVNPWAFVQAMMGGGQPQFPHLLLSKGSRTDQRIRSDVARIVAEGFRPTST